MGEADVIAAPRPATGWSRDRWLGGSSGRPLFYAIVAVRWASLAVALLGYARNLATHQMDFGHFVPMFAGATAYMAIVTVFSPRIYEWQKRSDVFLAIDYAVTLIAFSTTGTVWNPFLTFGACSFLFSGLRGNVRHGVVAGVIVGLLLVVSLPVKALSWQWLVQSDSLILLSVYVLQYVGFSAVWAYSVRLLAFVSDAHSEVEGNRAELEDTNSALDRRQRQRLALHRIRRAILLNVDGEEIVEIVERALGDSGFLRPRVWLLEEDGLTAFPHDGSAPIGLYTSHPLAVAAHDLETVMTECGEEEPADEGLPPACVATPIRTGDRVYGVMSVANDPSAPMSAERVEVFESFVAQLALAFSHLAVYERARDLAVAAERQRVTGEIHQNVVQKLYDARALVESVRAHRVTEETLARLKVLDDAILGSLQDLRFAVLDWRSLEWDTSPLELARRYVREFTVLSGITVTFDTQGEESCLSDGQARELLHILHEVLSNVWRHADASTVHTELVFSPEGASLAVSDDGRGFDLDTLRETGGGLRSIEERAKSAGGSVEVSSGPDEGTRVSVWFPCA